MLNISRSGAKLHAQQPVDPGQTIELEIAGTWIGGIVRWRRDATFGVAFHQPIDERTLQACLD